MLKIDAVISDFFAYAGVSVVPLKTKQVYADI